MRQIMRFLKAILPVLTQERLCELLDYDPETGIFRWRVDRPPKRAGDVAGTPTDTGYIKISVDGYQHRAHRLAWLWMTGEWPRAFIDHRDMDKANNRWANLREATKGQNHANRPSTARSGLKGAWYLERQNRWTSQVQKDGKVYHLGYFDTAEEAHAAYRTRAAEIHGEFARFE